MDNRDHYPTVAAFQVRDEDGTLNELTLDDEAPSKARIKKVCLCGSPIIFNAEPGRWVCSASSTDLEIYCAPLLSTPELVSKFGLNMPELLSPHSESLVTFDETGALEVFLKVQAKYQWIISDPLPIFENLSIKPFETDLSLSWYLSVGGFTRTLDFQTLWNVANPAHQRILKRLASSSNIPLYFLDARSLSMIGGMLLKLSCNPSPIVTKVFELNASLPKDERERREILSCMALGQEAASMSRFEKLGMCGTVAMYLISQSKEPFDLSEHMKTCSLCQSQHL